MKIAIVLPFYNPSPDWVHTIVSEYYGHYQDILNNFEHKLVLINDGSTANLGQDIAALENKIPCLSVEGYEQNQGKGAAIRYGLTTVEADLYIITDIDLPYQTDALCTVLNSLQTSGMDNVFIGQRDQQYYKKIPFTRRVISKVLHGLNRATMRMVTNDTQCGFKAFDNVGKELFMNTRTDGFLYDLEFIKIVSRSKVKYQLVPVRLRQGIGLSSIRPLSLFREFKDFIAILLFR